MAKRKDTRAGDRHAGELTAKTIRLTDDQLKRLNQGKKKQGGTYADAIDAAMRVYLGQNATDWPAELRRLAAEMEGGKG